MVYTQELIFIIPQGKPLGVRSTNRKIL